MTYCLANTLVQNRLNLHFFCFIFLMRPHLSFLPPSAIFVLFNRPAFSSSWGHDDSYKRCDSQHRYRYYDSNVAQTYVRRSWSANSEVQRSAFPLSNIQHPEQTHLTRLLHHSENSRRRAALKSPTAAWPRLRSKRTELAPTMRM